MKTVVWFIFGFIVGGLFMAPGTEPTEQIKCFEDEVIVWTGDSHTQCVPLDDIDATSNTPPNAPQMPQVESTPLQGYSLTINDDCASDACLIMAQCNADVKAAIAPLPYPVEGYCSVIDEPNIGGYAHWPTDTAPLTIQIDPFKGNGDYHQTIKHELCHVHLMHYFNDGSHGEAFINCMNS